MDIYNAEQPSPGTLPYVMPVRVLQPHFMVLVSSLFVFAVCNIPLRFAVVWYPYVPPDDIVATLVTAPRIAVNAHAAPCPPVELTDSHLPVRSVVASDEELAAELAVQPGGTWRPPRCESPYRVAVVVPYRNRAAHLRQFLHHMHPLLTRQGLDYRVFVIEQTSRLPFNRAKLFNIGYTEALKRYPYHCLILHDIDLVPQRLSNVYACTGQPRHMPTSLDTFRYNLPYTGLLGGAVAILTDQFQEINGFSNSFFGWGGEDDDFFSRISSFGYRVVRFSPDVARYVMLRHRKEPPNKDRYKVMGDARQGEDGLNSLNYTLVEAEECSLYTRLLVDL